MARPARTYRKVEPDVWTSSDFRALSAAKPNAQTLWLHLLTSPRTIPVPGVIVATPGVIADDLRWSRRGLDKALAEIVAAGMAEVDPDAGIVVLAKALIADGRVRDSAHPGSINAVKSWVNSLLRLKSCRLRNVIASRLSMVMESIGGEFPKAFAEAMAESCTTDLASHPVSISPAIGTQGSGIRDQISFSPVPAVRPIVPAVFAPAARYVALAVELLNAARSKIDPSAQIINADQGDEMALMGHLRAIPEDKREAAIRHGVAVIAESVKVGKSEISALRPGELMGPKSWRKWQAATVESIRASAAPRPSQRFANDRQIASMPSVGKGPAPVVVSASDRAAAAEELKRSREALGIVADLARSIGATP